MSDDECLLRLAQAIEEHDSEHLDEVARLIGRLAVHDRIGGFPRHRRAARRRAARVLRFADACTKDDAGFSSLGGNAACSQGLSQCPVFATARQKMVDGQVRPSDVTDIRIIDAMLAVPREAFVPENKQALAYLDLDLDVSEGGAARAVPDQAGGAGEDAAGG